MSNASNSAVEDGPLANPAEFIITTTPQPTQTKACSDTSGSNSNAASYIGLFGGSGRHSHAKSDDQKDAHMVLPATDDVSALSDSYLAANEDHNGVLYGDDNDSSAHSLHRKVRPTNAVIEPKTRGGSYRLSNNKNGMSSSAYFRVNGGSSAFFRSSFLNGNNDINDQHNNPTTLSIPGDRIYGRAKEQAVLEEALAKTETIDRQLLVMEGQAGAGKSSLAHQLRYSVHAQGGFFLGGKYDKNNNTAVSGMSSGSGGGVDHPYAFEEPYSAVTMACRELCDALLAHKEEERIRKLQGQPQQALESINEDSFESRAVATPAMFPHWKFTFDDFQAKLRAELDPAVLNVLTTVFPDLTQILGGNYLTDQLSAGSSANIEIGYNEAQEQFKYAMRKLLRVVCSFGKVVLFLDDCQWADAASLDLLKNVITDCRVNSSGVEFDKATSTSSEKVTVNTTSTSASQSIANPAEKATGLVEVPNGEDNGLLLLVSYRSDEVHEKHPLLRVIEEIKAETTKDESVSLSVDISKLVVSHLGMDQINELLYDILATDSLQETTPLAECIYRKTEGNILYVIQFLRTLSSETQERPLLKYNAEKSKWEWDVDEIRLHESATQNVVQTIQQKLKNLQDGVRLLLPVVGLLGTSFEYPIFQRVLIHFNKIFELNMSRDGGDTGKVGSRALSPDEFLAVCDEEGVLVCSQEGQQICWDHDKIQEAALDLVSAHELSKLRIRLGRFLMESFSKADQDKSVFILVNLLDGLNNEIPAADSNRMFLAELNWKAGSKSFRANAFMSAALYLDRAIEVLPEDHWHEHYDFSLDLFTAAAEAHFCTGQLAEANSRCDEVRRHAGFNKLDLQRVNTVALNVMNAQGQTVLAQTECINILSEIGCKFPRRGLGLRTLGGLIKLGMKVQSLEEKISKLPVMTDPTNIWAMRLLDRLVAYTYQNESDMFGLVVLKAFHYTLKYGCCDYTPPCLVTVGMMLGGVLGDYDAMYRFGELALEQYNTARITKSAYPRAKFIANGFNFSLHKSTWVWRKDCLDCYKEGMASGDVESGLWCILMYMETGLTLGLPLQPLEKDLHAYTQQMSDLKQEKIGIPAMCLWQAVSNLLGHSDKWSDLENVCTKRIETVFGVCEQSEHTQAFGHHYRQRNAFYCGDYDKVLSIMDCYDCDKIFFCSYTLPTIHFQNAIAAFAVFQNTQNKRYKKLALQESKKALHLSKWGNPCLRHYASFIEAEKEALQRRNYEKAAKLYKKTIYLASDQRIVHDQALANERLGDLYLCHDQKSKALEHFEEASKLYLQWGSVERSKVVLTFKNRQSLQAPAPTLPGSSLESNSQKHHVSDGVFVVAEEH